MLNTPPVSGVLPPYPEQHPYQYQQMQPFSPCPSMPPMPNYPQAAATPQPGQLGSVPMHPAYQQPPQLPGAYPRSPSRQNPHRAAQLQEWMNPHMTSYSPVPSVAPSVMSGMSGVYSDHGSVMSYGSILPFDMPMECPMDMRSPSQISSMSGSENIDPMHVNPSPFPPQTNLAELPQFLPHWKQHFFDMNAHNHIVRDMTTFLKQLQGIDRRRRKGDYDLLRSQLMPIVEMVPVLIRALGQFTRNKAVMREQGSSYANCCACFKIIVRHFPEDAVAKEIALDKGIVVVVENLRCQWNPSLAHAVDMILGWKGSVAEKAKFRATVRGQQNFTIELLAQLNAPKTMELILFQLGILASLAHHTESVKSLLSCPSTGNALVPIIFQRINVVLGSRPKSSIIPTILRQIIKIVSLLLGEEGERRLAEQIRRQVKVAIQLLQFNGLSAICDVFHNSLRNREHGLFEISNATANILRNFCNLLVDTTKVDVDVASDVERYKAMMRTQTPGGFIDVNVALMIVTSMDILTTMSDIPCGKAHQAIAQSLYELARFSPTVRDYLKQPQLLETLIHWITRFVALKSVLGSKEKWDAVASCALDTEDTLLCTFNVIVFNTGFVPDSVLPGQKAEEVMRLFLSQMSDIYHNERDTIFGSRWSAYMALFTRIIVCIGRLVKHCGSVHHGGILTRVTDSHKKENAIAWLMLLVGEMQSRFEKVDQRMEVRKRLADIAKEAICTLHLIWEVFDPMRLPNGTEVRNKIKVLVVNTCNTQLIRWISIFEKEKTYVIKILEFCSAICVEEVSLFWRDNCQRVFQELCLSQDPDINRLANQICNSFNPENTQSMFEEMSQAMDGGYY